MRITDLIKAWERCRVLLNNDETEVEVSTLELTELYAVVNRCHLTLTIFPECTSTNTWFFETSNRIQKELAKRGLDIDSSYIAQRESIERTAELVDKFPRVIKIKVAKERDQ